jgi:hypothetical protein
MGSVTIRSARAVEAAVESFRKDLLVEDVGGSNSLKRWSAVGFIVAVLLKLDQPQYWRNSAEFSTASGCVLH